MRMVQLNSTWSLNDDGTGVLHSSQMPPNPSIMAPGPALLYIVINGVPSTGIDIMVGDGEIGDQTIYPVPTLPGTIAQSGATISTTNSGTKVDGNAASSNNNSSGGNSGAGVANVVKTTSLALGVVAAVAAVLL